MKGLNFQYEFQKTHVAAIATRDLARQNQHRKEIALLSECKEREKKLIECRLIIIKNFLIGKCFQTDYFYS